MKKRIVVFLLMLFMIFGMIGCSEHTGSSENTSNNSTDNKSSADISFPLEEKETLKIMISTSPLAPEDPNDQLIWQRYEEETNVHIDWEAYSSDVFIEKRNLAFNTSEELADAVFNAQMSDYDILTNAKNGIIIPVEDLIDNHMPRLKKIFDEYPEYRKGVTAPDGHIYTFPWIEELGRGKHSIHSINGIPWINTTWLSNLGLDMPETTKEFTDVLRAFKDQDADGDGNPDNEIPLSYIFGDGGNTINVLLGAFGYGDNHDHYIVDNDGNVIFTMAEEGYKEGIKWINKLYAEGLIDQDIFTQDWNTYVAKGKAQKLGVFFTWDMGNVAGFVSGDYSDPENIVSDYEAMPILAGPDGTRNLARSNGRGFDRGRMCITADNEKLELTAKWIDGLYDPIQSAQNNWGTYGDEKQPNIFEYDEEENMLKHLPLGDVSPIELREKTSVGGPLAILDKYYDEYVTLPDDAAWRMDIVSNVYVPFMYSDYIYPLVFFDQEDIEELVNLETSIREYALSKQADWIMNGNIDEEWDEYLDQLQKLNLDRYLEILQKYCDENLITE